MYILIKQKWFRALLKGFSLTSALFIFQACYGTPQDFGLDLHVYGQVRSNKTGLPVKGIKVAVEDNAQYGFTDNDGNFSLYTYQRSGGFMKFSFEDTDQSENGSFLKKDTLFQAVSDKYLLNVKLEEI